MRRIDLSVFDLSVRVSEPGAMAEDWAFDLGSFERRIRQLRDAAQAAATREAALASFSEVLDCEGELHRAASLDHAERERAQRGLHAIALELLDLGARARPAEPTPAKAPLEAAEEQLELLNMILYIDGATGGVGERLADWMSEIERTRSAVVGRLAGREIALQELLDVMALAHWVYTTIPDREPDLGARAEALWAGWTDAAMQHPVTRAALALRKNAKDAGWRYDDIERHAGALAVDIDEPAELIIALVLGSEPLPYGPGQESEFRHGRNGYGTTSLAMIRAALSLLELGPGDTFYDLGSGIGLPTAIAALSSEATCRGVEYHRCYVERAEENARGLGLSRVQYRCGDVCAVDWSDGNKFYVSNPFPGEVLGRVVARLLKIARQRPIRVACFATALPTPSFRKICEQERIALFVAGANSFSDGSTD